MEKIPGWAVFVIVAVGLYFIIGQIGKTANATIDQIGKTKASTAQGYASAAVGAVGGFASAIGSFFGGASKGVGTPAVAQTVAPNVGSFSSSPDESAWNNVTSDNLDTLSAEDAAAGVEGPF